MVLFFGWRIEARHSGCSRLRRFGHCRRRGVELRDYDSWRAFGFKRIGRDRFVRNVLYAIGNSAEPALSAVAQGLVDDPDPAVADAARWAVARLG